MNRISVFWLILYIVALILCSPLILLYWFLDVAERRLRGYVHREVNKEYVCVGCGHGFSTSDIMGSMKHPYCRDCFKEIWNNNDEAYLDWLSQHHI